MNCNEVRESLSAFLDNELSTNEKTLLQSHLDECTGCQKELEELQKVAVQLSSLEEVVPPASFRNELFAKLEEGLSKEVRQREKRVSLRGFMHKFTAVTKQTAFLPVAISLILLLIIVPVFFDLPRLGMKSTMKSTVVEKAGGLADFSSSAKSGAAENLKRNSVQNTASSLRASETMFSYDTANADESIQPQEANLLKTSAKEHAESPVHERKVIKNANLTLSVDDYDSTVKAIADKTLALDGYIVNESVQAIDGRGTKRGSLQIRIPQARFENFLAGVDTLGRVRHRGIFTDDVTEEYVDVESRLQAMRTKEERLLAILTKSGNLSDVLAVENELAKTRADLESLQGRLRYLNNRTDFSTFNITLEQLIASTQQVSASGLKGVGLRAKGAFIQAINNILVGLGKLVVFISAAIPYLVIVAVLGLGIRGWLRRKKNSKE